MADKFFSAIWGAIAPGLGNHLWQSTLVALAAALLTLLLRKHHARARYWIWLAASVKFLIPFSLLIGIGSRLASQRQLAGASSPTLYFAVEEISQPFTKAAIRAASTQTPSVAAPTLTQFLPWIVALWFVGFLAVLLVWILRWRCISKAMKAATPLYEGREVGTLRRMERAGGIRRPIALLLSRASLEPGIFGIVRPVLIWPEGISPQLHDAHLEAILAHEVWHVRRRDNLAAAFHMLVEAVFWFYPLVWWMGARLIEERERACDEEVLALGSDRQVYAESILKVCEFCLGSPLPCVSGVTGADLKKRMVRIMNNRILLKLDLARKLILIMAAFLAIALPITFGVFHATPGHAQSNDVTAPPARSFETITIKPDPSTENWVNRSKVMYLNDGSFTAHSVPLQLLVKLAYHVQDSQISGPSDLLSQRYDVDAKLSSAEIKAPRQSPMMEQRGGDQSIQALLRDRFKLAAHMETRNLPAYDLIVDKDGPKFQQSSNDLHLMRMANGELNSQGTHMAFLTDQLSIRLGRAVVDRTGLNGNYTFNLHWTPEPDEQARMSGDGMPIPPASSPVSGPPLATAVQDQLGLKLVPRTEAMQVLVIDHIEQPSEN
jgi:uncharacterized protein (TIGR03435 family)